VYLNNNSPIQSLIISGNAEVKKVANKIQAAGFDVRPIVSPTVAKGAERLRICIHAHNSKQQIDELCSIINQ
jgi:8-amino-7-oxononanoate synthase